jgi:hypothetical protein
MTNTELFEIEKMPNVSSLLSMFLSQIQVTGVLASFFIHSRSVKAPMKRQEFLNGIDERFEYFRNFMMVAEYNGAKLKLHSIPILYNTQHWRSEVLGGYFNPDFNINPSDLVISYRGCWRYEDSHRRLVKATLWYVRSRGDFNYWFDYLVDLFEAGYIIDRNEFVKAGMILLELYAKSENPIQLIEKLALDIDPGTTETALEFIRKGIASQNANDERIRNAYAMILKRLLEEISRARYSDSVGEWVLSFAKIQGLIDFVISMVRSYNSVLDLKVVDEAILSQIEEIDADFTPFRAGFLFFDKKHFPLIYNPFNNFARSVAGLYVRTYGDRAIEKLIGDRLLVPECLKDIVNKKVSNGQLDDDNIEESLWPTEWVNYPILFAYPFGLIKGIIYSLMRTQLFPKDQVIKKILDLFGGSDLVESDVRSIVNSDYFGDLSSEYAEYVETHEHMIEDPLLSKRRALKESIKNHMYEIHREMCSEELNTELRPLIRDYEAASTEELRTFIPPLIALLKLYPWHPSPYVEMSIIADYMADEKEALKNIKSAILLEPRSTPIWKSFSVICSKYGTQEEVRFSRAIENMLDSLFAKNRIDQDKTSIEHGAS